MTGCFFLSYQTFRCFAYLCFFSQRAQSAAALGAKRPSSRSSSQNRKLPPSSKPTSSAPDIAGKGVANPLAQILSVEMMLRYSFDMGEAADDIRRAVTAVLDEGWRTGDIKGPDTPADKMVGTAAMGDLVVERL